MKQSTNSYKVVNASHSDFPRIDRNSADIVSFHKKEVTTLKTTPPRTKLVRRMRTAASIRTKV